MANWAEFPYQLIKETGIAARPEIPHDHAVVHMTKSMALTHNVILRSINAAYHQCLEVQPGTTAASDFLFFNQSLVGVISLHHDIEEEYLFPELQRLSGDPLVMDSNIQEHAEFHNELHRFSDYVHGVSAQDYDGRKLRELIEKFGPLVEKHLHHEIPTLLDLYRYDSKEISQISEQLAQRTKARSGKFNHFPLFLGCADRTFQLDGVVESFPKIPMLVLYITKFLFEPWHSGAWDFNPSDTFGQPRSQPFKAKGRKRS